MARGLDGGNTFDTDNNETKAGQQTQETAFSVLLRVSTPTRSAVAPPCLNAVFPPWEAVPQYPSESVTFLKCVIKNPRDVRVAVGFAPNMGRG